MTSPRHTPTTPAKNEIVVYQPNDVLRLDVQLEHDTVWLTILQMCQLFGRERSVIAKHLNAAIQEGELDAGINVQNLHKNQKGRPQALYDLDAIISVGYRVKSLRGTQFRRWATNVLRDHLLKRFSVNARLNQLEDKMDRRLAKTEQDVIELKEQVGFFVKTALPPVEGVLFEGQIKDAYDVALKIIRSAKKSIVLVDNWIDDTVLTMLDKRAEGVKCTVYTKNYSKRLALDVSRHNAQYAPISVKPCRGAHDRFLIVDSTVYHVGASLKDLGKALFVFSKLVTPASSILARLL